MRTARSIGLPIKRPVRAAGGLVGLVLLGGCATSGVPEPIRNRTLPSPAVSAVQERPDDFVGRRVRWGGRILAVHNGPATTRIEILAKPLLANGAPDDVADAEGRFILELPGFKDPAELPTRRRLTLVGPIRGVERRDIGQYPYPYPVIAGGTWYLWPNPPPVDSAVPYPYPWYRPWAGPWYGPWYGLWY